MSETASPVGAAAPIADAAFSGTSGYRAAGSAVAADVAREFESVFLSMMLKQLRSTEQGDGLFAGDRSDMLGSMFDQYLGDHLAASGGFGLARMLKESGQSNANAARQALAELHAVGREAYQDAGTIR